MHHMNMTHFFILEITVLFIAISALILYPAAMYYSNKKHRAWKKGRYFFCNWGNHCRFCTDRTAGPSVSYRLYCPYVFAPAARHAWTAPYTSRQTDDAYNADAESFSGEKIEYIFEYEICKIYKQSNRRLNT